MQRDHQVRIAACDDDSLDLGRTVALAKQILQDANIAFSISEYSSAEKLLADIQGGMQFHILFLDVMMVGMDGMELAARLRKLENKTQIIFISANREMALQGYEVSAARYLTKPLDAGKMEEALLHCCRMLQEKKEILLPTAQGRRRISYTDIQFAEAFERGTKFILTDETVESRLKFSEVETMLPPTAFILCHRAFVVNLSEVKYIRPYEFTLKSGRVVPIGKGRYAEIHKKFVDYLAN